MEEKIEIRVGDTVMIATTDPTGLFRILRALKEDGQEPLVRWYDEELRDFTCWQPVCQTPDPTRKAA